MSEALVKSNVSQLPVQAWTNEQRDLIKRTVAPNATDDELSLFLHISQVSGLDPLRKQIHFIKAQGRVYTVADINGLQARAAREPDFEGILHAVVYQGEEFVVDHTTGQVVKHASNPLTATGKPIGAWATVKRRGMLPFTSIVRFAEYNSGSGNWANKPAVMIDKVAKSTAIRLAYPEQLGGVYERAELDQTMEEKEVNATPAPAKAEPSKRAETVKAQVLARAATVEAKAEPKALPASTPMQRIAFMLTTAGKGKVDAANFIKATTGKAKREDLDDNDVALIENALKAESAQATGVVDQLKEAIGFEAIQEPGADG